MKFLKQKEQKECKKWDQSQIIFWDWIDWSWLKCVQLLQLCPPAGSFFVIVPEVHFQP